jgi:hypothetical protein
LNNSPSLFAILEPPDPGFPPYSQDPVSLATVRDLPSTCAWGQDDGSSKRIPSNEQDLLALGALLLEPWPVCHGNLPLSLALSLSLVSFSLPHALPLSLPLSLSLSLSLLRSADILDECSVPPLITPMRTFIPQGRLPKSVHRIFFISSSNSPQLSQATCYCMCPTIAFGPSPLRVSLTQLVLTESESGPSVMRGRHYGMFPHDA